MNAYLIALLASAQPAAEPNTSVTTPSVVPGVPGAEPDLSSPALDTAAPAPDETPATTESPPPESSPARDPDASTAMRRAEATKHVRRADMLFREARYDEAIDALRLAEDQWSDPAHDFMRGTIEKRRGNCDVAKRAFERFLAQDPPALDAEVAREQVRDCHEEPPPVSLAPTFETAAPDIPPPTPTKHWTRDVPGGVLFGVGVAGTMVGAGFLIANRLDTEVPVTYSDFNELGARRTRRQRVGTGLVVASSTLIAASVVRYVWVGRQNKKSRHLATARLFAPQPAGSPALLRW